MGQTGVPELLVILTIVFLWIVPVAVGIWAVVTLYRIRSDQQVVRTKLDAIERLLQRS